jgi:AraC-like DNA-binding protein
MTKPPDQERVRFVFRRDFADVELLCADETPRTWTVFNSTFAFAMLRTWHGRVDYRRRRVDAGPGEVFCSEPGEVHSAVPATFEAQCRVEGLRPPPHFAQIMAKATPRLGGALRNMHAALLEGEATLLELQSRLAVLTQAAIAEVIEPLPRPVTRLPVRESIQQLRELLHNSQGERVSLLEFAQSSGMSQFQLLRGFKRMYGLPPHEYQLNRRVELAREMLRRGYTAAQAAAANDFADQSHFTRHFRRIWGLTPGQYAR